MIVAATAACWAVALVRVWVSVRGPLVMWRWAFTMSIVFTAVGISATAWDTTIDGFTTPNLAVLLLEEALIISIGCSFIYLLTLLNEKLAPANVWAVVAILTLVALAIWSCWLIAPVHSRELKSIYLFGAHMPSVQGFAVLFFATVTCELMASAMFTVRLTRTIHADDPTGQFGGWLVAVSTAVGAAVFLLSTFLVFIRPSHSATITLSGILRNICALVVMGIMLGAIIMVGGPRLLRFRSQRRYARCLRPLWLGLKEQFPVVALHHPRGGLKGPRPGGDSLERMLIEIHDGLDLLQVAVVEDSLAEITATLVAPVHAKRAGALVPASTTLPIMKNQKEEREVLELLADKYRRASRQAVVTVDAN